MTLRTIGKIVAPARFIAFFLMLAASIAAATMFTPWWRSVMLGFDLSSLVFILSCIRLYNAEAAQMREVAVADNANRVILLILVFALGIVILVAVGSEMASDKATSALDIAITIVTLLIAWFFGNTVYALHYSHLFYTADDGGRDQAGIDFPGAKDLPAFSDFVYFAFTIGSSLSISDTPITSLHVRKIVTAHTIVAFIFNVGIFALTVNMLAGKG